MTQTRLIDAEASVAHQQALREYYRILNAGNDALRAAQDELLINERARELAAIRVLDLNERRAAVGDAVTDALLDEVRAAETHLATLRAEQAELELTLSAIVRLQEAYRALAESNLTAARRDNPFAELILGADELNQELDRVAADGVSNLADGLAELVVRGRADFRSLVESIIQDLLRVFIQATIVNNLISGLGLGGSGGGLGAIFGNIFHEGGRTEEGGRRRQLRGGLRNDELFAILQKGEVVVPRHLAPHLLSGNFDALRGWLARLPRFHEGGIAGGGHLEREDIIQLTATIQQLSQVVAQLSAVVTRLGGGEAPAGTIETPAGMGGDVRGFLDEAREGVESFANDAGGTLERFFLEDIPGYAGQARQLIDEQLFGDETGGRFGEGPFARGQRAFEEQARDRALASDVDRRRGELGQQRDDTDSSIQELLDRAREQTDREQQQLRQLEEQRQQDTQIFQESVQTFADAVSAAPQPGRAFESGRPADDLERQSFFRMQSQQFQDTIIEIQRRAQRPGDPSEFNRLRELVDSIELELPIPPGYRFEPMPTTFFHPALASFGATRGGDTPRPDLLPEGEGIMLFREESNAAFAESAAALSSTFGAGGTMGQVTGESQGLLSDLFSRFGGQLTNVLNDVLGSVGGQGIGSVLGSVFGFHEGTGDVGGGAMRYHRPAGLRSDELLAVLQRGEIVLPRGLAQRLRTGGFHSIGELQLALSRLPRFHEGGMVGGGGAGAGGAPTRIELINTTNTPIETVDNGQRIDAGQRVQSLILRDIRVNGPITQGMGLALGRR